MSDSEGQSVPDSKPESAANASDSWEVEDKRLRDIRNKRRSLGACIMCGKPMGWFDKRAGREKHEKCMRFIE